MKNINIFLFRDLVLLPLFIWLLFPLNPLIGQTFCHTTSSANALGAIATNSEGINSFSGPYFLKIYIHVIRQSNGMGGQAIEDVIQLIDLLDADFNPHDIYFLRDCEIDYIDNDEHYYASVCQIGYLLDPVTYSGKADPPIPAS